MHHLFFGHVNAEDLVPLAEVAGELQRLLQRTGHYDGPLSEEFDEPTRQALGVLVGQENLEEDGTAVAT